MATKAKDEVSSDISVAPRKGGLYQNAEGQFVGADGVVLEDDEAEEALSVAKAAADKRAEEAKPVSPTTTLTLTEAELSARIAAAVAAAPKTAGTAENVAKK